MATTSKQPPVVLTLTGGHGLKLDHVAFDVYLTLMAKNKGKPPTRLYAPEVKTALEEHGCSWSAFSGLSYEWPMSWSQFTARAARIKLVPSVSVELKPLPKGAEWQMPPGWEGPSVVASCNCSSCRDVAAELRNDPTFIEAWWEAFPYGQVDAVGDEA